MAPLPTTRFVITSHAVRRFRQRVYSPAGRADLRKWLAQSTKPGSGTRKKLREQCRKAIGRDSLEFNRSIYARDTRPISVYWFCLKIQTLFVTEQISAGVFRVMTCWKLDVEAGSAERRDGDG